MTIGIYRLCFSGTTKVYVGQSVNIEKRYLQHLNDFKNNLSAPKLLNAFTLYGKPTLDILVECTVSELDSCEEESIQIFNSVIDGFNSYNYSNQAPVQKGTEAGNAKYSEEQILTALTLLTVSGNTINMVTNITGINRNTIVGIMSGSCHIWVKEKHKELLKSANDILVETNRLNRVSLCKNIFSVKAKNIKYLKVISPQGKTYVVENINEFAKEQGTISKSSLHRLLSGQVTKTKGWVVCQEEPVL